ncbi:MAG: hypothetical protein Tsb002_28070 [Wenzhouxiangellaceae bacterium]
MLKFYSLDITLVFWTGRGLGDRSCDAIFSSLIARFGEGLPLKDRIKELEMWQFKT